MLANTEWVTFADDDVWWEPTYLKEIKQHIDEFDNWLSVTRRIWSPDTNKVIGVDRFESVGDSPERKVSYEMCDGNTMIFRRAFGVFASHLYRETTMYNDDRLMYNFLKNNAGKRKSIDKVLINQICPERLINFFKNNCSLL